MMLQVLENKDYPLDYLLSRLRKRRHDYGYLNKVSASKDIWKNFLLERMWLYTNMNKEIRSIFEPVFLYFEIKNLIIILRNKASSGEVSEMLNLSLFDKGFKKNLLSSTDMTEAIKEIGCFFFPLSENFHSLLPLFKERGLKEVENKLMKFYLESMINRRIDPIVKIFIKSLIDFKNILIIHKYLRWQLEKEPEFIKGGNIGLEELKRAFKEKDTKRIKGLLNRLSGLKVNEDLEISMMEGIRRIILKYTFDPLSISNILDYIWGCFIYSISLGMNLYNAQTYKVSI